MISENDIQHYYRIEKDDLIKLCNIAFVAGCNSYHDLADFKAKEIVEKFVEDNKIAMGFTIELDDISHNKITHDDRWVDDRSLEHKTVDFFDQAEKINGPSPYKGILNPSSALPSNFVTISSNEISQNITILEMANKEYIMVCNPIELTINPSFEGKTLTITSSKDNN